MQEGKRVTRPGIYDKDSFFYCGSLEFVHFTSDIMGDLTDALDVESLIADDWEIAE